MLVATIRIINKVISQNFTVVNQVHQKKLPEKLSNNTVRTQIPQ